MRLTVLGRSGSFPAAGEACSGYLVEEGKTHLLLDCGNGVLSRLQQRLPIDSLDAILLSHLHFDHIGDLFPLRYALETRLANGEKLRPIPLYLPQTPVEIFTRLKEGDLFDVHPIAVGQKVQIGSLQIRFFSMTHTVEAYALRLEGAFSSLAYSGDTTANDELRRAAQDVSLFLCEATGSGEEADAALLPHLTARQAARTASTAQAHSLLLTHLWYQQDPEQLLAEAREIFPAARVAQEFQTYDC